MYLCLKNKTNYTQLSNSSTLNGCKTATKSLFPVSHGLKKTNLLDHRETASQFVDKRAGALSLSYLFCCNLHDALLKRKPHNSSLS